MLSSSRKAEKAESQLGEALLDAIVGWSDWCHRRVDSIHPLEGERGRLRHSMDCSPPPEPRLAFDPAERRKRRIQDVDGLIIVPLARVVKGAMRHLDASDSRGNPLPLLGSSETTALAVAILGRALHTQDIKMTPALRVVLAELAGPLRPPFSDSIAKALAETGSWHGVEFWKRRVLPEDVVELLQGFEQDFLLSGLIPAEDAGRRQVLKFSFHWSIDPEPILWRLLRPAVSFGLANRSVEITMTAPRDTRSYHLEFQTPPELRCRKLQLPDSPGQVLGFAATDTSGAPVAHVHHAYTSRPRGNARIELSVPPGGAWTASFLACVVTAIVFWLAILLPGAQAALLSSSGSAAAILLAAPAVFMGLLAARAESALAAWMLNPLRTLMLVCSLLLFSMAASIVGRLDSPWIECLWSLGAWLTTGLAGVLASSRVASVIFSRSPSVQSANVQVSGFRSNGGRNGEVS